MGCGKGVSGGRQRATGLRDNGERGEGRRERGVGRLTCYSREALERKSDRLSESSEEK